MALANVSLTDTFDTWRIRTNQLIVLYDQSNNQISSAFSNVPLAFGHANAAFDKANAANVLAFNAFPKAGGVVTGNTTFSANANFLSVATFSSNADFLSTATFSSNADFLSTATFSSNADFLSTSTFSGNTTFSANANFLSTSTFSSNTNFLSNTSFFGSTNFFGVSNFSSTNDITFSSSNVIFLGNVSLSGILANGSLGSSGQLLTSNGTGVYWSTVSGGGASLTITANNTSEETFYLPMSNTDSNLWSSAVVSNTKLFFVPSTGTLSSTVFNSLSDEKHKTNIIQIENALDSISEMRGVTFNWKEDNRPSVGVIAQEVEKVFPELVTTHDKNKSVNYDGLVAVLIEAIKELRQEIQDLKSNKE